MDKNKGVTINPKNTKDDNCFQYAIVAALNCQNIDHPLERISKLKPFISYSKDWRKFECNNKTIALNILYVPYNAKHINEQDNDYDDTKEIRHAYKSKHTQLKTNLENIKEYVKTMIFAI